MKLDLNRENFFEFIEKISINKVNDLIICLPTFNSFEITKATINSFFAQENINFDLLIIGPSGDIEKLVEVFPNINFCLTKDNFGSSGNQLLNIYLSNYFNYKFTMLSDNDAVLLEKDGLQKMFKNLISQNLWVTYPNNKKFYSKTNNNFFMTFHCCLYNNEIFKNIENLFNPNYFLTLDDIAFLGILLKYINNIDGTNTSYYHPYKINSMFTYQHKFFLIRSHFIFAFREKVPLKFKLIRFDFKTIITWIISATVNFDLEFFKIFLMAVYQVITENYYLPIFKLSKVKYIEISSPNDKSIYKESNFFYESIFPRKNIYQVEMNNIVKYYVRE